MGMTRAMRELFLTYAQSRFSFSGRSYTSPSRFLLELGYRPYGSPDGFSGDGSDEYIDDLSDTNGDEFVDREYEDDLPVWE